MNRYIARCIDRLIERDLSIFGAVLIQGPKWCGKTTTAQRFAASSLSLSDPAGGFAALQLARLDPAQAVVGSAPRLIDEWQEEPKIWDAVRFECDRRMGEPGQFLLTGSATPNAASQPMHSGVGRVSRLRMDTMTLLELGISSGSVSLGFDVSEHLAADVSLALAGFESDDSASRAGDGGGAVGRVVVVNVDRRLG